MLSAERVSELVYVEIAHVERGGCGRQVVCVITWEDSAAEKGIASWIQISAAVSDSLVGSRWRLKEERGRFPVSLSQLGTDG